MAPPNQLSRHRTFESRPPCLQPSPNCSRLQRTVPRKRGRHAPLPLPRPQERPLSKLLYFSSTAPLPRFQTRVSWRLKSRRPGFSLEKTSYETVKVFRLGSWLFFPDFLFTLTKFPVPRYIACQKNWADCWADGLERRHTAGIQSTISMRCGPGSASATRSSSANRSAVFTDTAGTSIPWLIFTQSITGSERSVSEMVYLPGET